MCVILSDEAAASSIKSLAWPLEKIDMLTFVFCPRYRGRIRSLALKIFCAREVGHLLM